MKIEKVKKLSPEGRFWYWIKERWNIYQRREAGKPKPWTDDVILQDNFFTMPYRELDKTTKWFREVCRGGLARRKDDNVLMATVIFRWFNRIETGKLLNHEGLLLRWNEKKAVRVLRKLNESGPVFGGAYMIKAGNGPPGCKIPNVCKAISNVHTYESYLIRVCKEDCRLQALHKELCKFPHLGGFMSYEIVCDLRYTHLLEDATDVNTWTNLGPGAARGLQRILGQPVKIARTGMKDTRPKPPENWLDIMKGLLRKSRKKLKGMPLFEMREVEHSLCEYDKMDRVLFGQGRSKRKYDGQ